jgi:hypothetical protein
VFSELDSILLLIEKIIDNAVECRIEMSTTKKGEQLLENVKDSAVL